MKRLALALVLVLALAPWAAAQKAPAAPASDQADPWTHLRDFRDDSSYLQVLHQSQAALRDQAATAAAAPTATETPAAPPSETRSAPPSEIRSAPLPAPELPARPPANYAGAWLPQLAARVNLDLDTVSLASALQFLADATGASISVDPRLKADTGKSADEEQVTLHIKAITLQQALDLVVPPEMGWHVSGGAILLSSREKANPLRLHTYSIRDLITPIPDFGSSAPHFDLTAAMGQSGGGGAGGGGGGGGGGAIFQQSAAEEAVDNHPEQKIIALIKKFVTSSDPRVAAWDDAGGPATVEYFNGLLLVNQTDAGHRKVIDLLSKL